MADRSVRDDIAPAAVMGMMGAAKFLVPMSRDQFEVWGYPRWWAGVTGTLELASAAMLAVPRTRPLGAGLTGAVLAGAVATHLQHREYRILPLPLSVGLLVGIAAWRRVQALGWALERPEQARERPPEQRWESVAPRERVGV